MNTEIEIRDDSDPQELLRITADGRALTQKEDGTYVDITDVVAEMVETLPKVVEQRRTANETMKMIGFETWWNLFNTSDVIGMTYEEIAKRAFYAGMEYRNET